MQIAISLHMMNNKLDSTLFISILFLYFAFHFKSAVLVWDLGVKNERREGENNKLDIRMGQNC
jgi:hypothetical protein